MEVRKTIVYIGNREDESQLFEKAIELSGRKCNFLSLESGYWALRLLHKSLPFWYHSIVLDLAKPSAQGIQFLKEIKGIRHLQHVPVIVYTDAVTLDNINVLNENGASHYISKPARTETLVPIFNSLGKNEVLPFLLNYPAHRPMLQSLRQAS